MEVLYSIPFSFLTYVHLGGGGGGNSVMTPSKSSTSFFVTFRVTFNVLSVIAVSCRRHILSLVTFSKLVGGGTSFCAAGANRNGSGELGMCLDVLDPVCRVCVMIVCYACV